MINEVKLLILQYEISKKNEQIQEHNFKLINVWKIQIRSTFQT